MSEVTRPIVEPSPYVAYIATCAVPMQRLFSERYSDIGVILVFKNGFKPNLTKTMPTVILLSGYFIRALIFTLVGVLPPPKGVWPLSWGKKPFS